MMRHVFGWVIVLAVLCAASQLWASTIDATTQGNWKGIYGSDGYILCDYAGIGTDVASLPSFVTGYSYGSNVGHWVETSSTTEVRALQPVGGTTRTVGEVYGANPSLPFTIDLTLTNNAPSFQLAAYAVSWAPTDSGRSETIMVGSDTATLSSFADGKWAVFDVNPNGVTSLSISVQTIGANNSIVNGVMFSAVPEPSTLVLLASGLVGLLCYAWRKRK